MPFKEARHPIPAAVELIDLIQYHHRRFAFRANFLEDRIDSIYLFVGLRITYIDNVQKQIEALTTGLRKVSDEFELSRPALQLVGNN